MKLKIKYSSQPYKKSYPLLYGLPPFRYPFRFRYADGVGYGNYHFLYDSRGEILNQDTKKIFTIGRDHEVRKENLIQKISFRENELFLENLIQKIAFKETELLLNDLIQKFSFKESELSLNDLIQEFSFKESELFLNKILQKFSFKETELSLDNLIQKFSFKESELSKISQFNELELNHEKEFIKFNSKQLDYKQERNVAVINKGFKFEMENKKEINTKKYFSLERKEIKKILVDKKIFLVRESSKEVLKKYKISLDKKNKSSVEVFENYTLDSNVKKEVQKFLLKNDIQRSKVSNIEKLKIKDLDIKNQKDLVISKEKNMVHPENVKEATRNKINNLTRDENRDFLTPSNDISLLRELNENTAVIVADLIKKYIRNFKKNILVENIQIYLLKKQQHELITEQNEFNFIRKFQKKLESPFLSKFFSDIHRKEIFFENKNVLHVRKIYEFEECNQKISLERDRIKNIKIPNIKKILERKIQKETFKNIPSLIERNNKKDLDISWIHEFLRENKKELIQEIQLLIERMALKEIIETVLDHTEERRNEKNIYRWDSEKFFETLKVKEIYKEMLINFFDLETSKEIEKINLDVLISRICKEKKLNLSFFSSLEKAISRELDVKNLISCVEGEFKRNLSSVADLFELEKITGRELEFLVNKFLSKESKDLGIKKIERDLTLYKRLWFLDALEPYDILILPKDSPYSSEPIEFNGPDLVPENGGVVYPNEFYKRIDAHPIPWGADFEPEEIPVAINIIVDLVNIFILLWAKFQRPFWGWTGTQAVLGITESLYQWITLETSQEKMREKGVLKHYERAFKWIRWESEKMSLKARNDTNLNGNYYVGLLLEELLFYLKDHHFDIVPLFEDVEKMDEWRQSFRGRPLENDIKFILDKVKGIRHKILIGKEQQDNA